ncbi:ubiquitin carboxyl-terminal hydrolase 4/11 [Emericellopsis cladophorae]|uniref:ubiquitinyl hydrolase 1 n=1 Tax=Emericellopsis cladophorae TaxID=2686198 RepID=A0A9P9Y8X4_9HYPO|nr:ubiquitin carboxyl-terminal hydrolase 4/11 [Emericellopsis cladophorae]KAI6785739.1 ubiquitin carboxyl-terminal hydrolase 4/11 [Emericellopsis cladophorae]
MNGDAGCPQRSSSPLKRRASSMEPDQENGDQVSAEIQVSGGFPRAMSLDPQEGDGSKSEVQRAPTTPPPIQEQVKIIETLLQAAKEAPPKEGDKAYLVSRTWVDQALALRKQAADTDCTLLGPVDNASIIEDVIIDSSGKEFTRLKPGTGEESFELFPEDAWNMVVDWYGIKDNQKPIVREAINRAPDSESPVDICFELHPPIFRIHRLWSELSPLPIEQSLKANKPPPVTLVRSRKAQLHAFLKEAKTLAHVPLDRKIRLHALAAEQAPGPELPNPSEGSALTPPDSPKSNGTSTPQGIWSQLLVGVPAFSEVRDLRMELRINDTTINPKFNGRSALQIYDLVTDQTLIIDESINGKSWVSTYTEKDASKPTKNLKTLNPDLSSANSSRRSSPGPGVMTRGRAQHGRKIGRSLGAVGLHNLGNTCYMNSALQCVRSVEELSKYFLTDSNVDEINKSNPLGYNGRVALAYYGLLKEIYEQNRGSVSPRDFKSTVGRCRSTFQGWGQQDTQEFLGFLLDGLQEDLSRIKKKPYIEKPDSTDDMINDPEAIRKMADDVWDITRRRDDSVIADLFTGMYKSTLKCPECGKISITFDPFNNLTLPLPIKEVWSSPVIFYPLNDVPVKIEVELPKHSAMDSLKQYMSTRTGVPVERLMGAEEFKGKFFKIYSDNEDVSEEIGNSDIPVVHELETAPSNWPLKSKKKSRSMLDLSAEPAEWDDPAYEQLLVPVFHRAQNASRMADMVPPHFIVLSKDEAFNYEAIQRKVLEKLATFSSFPALREGMDETAEIDGVVVSASDAESSNEAKVTAQSVKDEEDTVDITMKDSADSVQARPLPHEPQLLKQFNKRRPAYAKSGAFLDPSLQNLFELCYFTDGTDSVPSGWSQLQSYRQQLPKVADRMPQPSGESDHSSPGSWDSTASGNDDSGAEADVKTEVSPPSSQTRMAEESSEEDGPARFERRSPPRKMKGGKKKFNKEQKTYGKKALRREKKLRKEAQKAASAAVRPQPTPRAQADGGPLLRLGEGLVVEWNDDAWEHIFGKSMATFSNIETLHDTALKISKTRRESRRSRGITLEECLDEFERAEILSEQDMWYCPRCKEHRRASKKFDLWKSPDILVAHLKRFSSAGYRRDKLDVRVDFPIEGLDLTSRVIQKEDGQNEIYDLIAVDDHYGGLGGGHYTAYAKNFMDGKWYNYNDSSVSQVSDPQTVVTNAAYLLFYRRRSSRPLGGPRFADIFDKFDNGDEAEEDSSTEMENDSQANGGYGQSRPAIRNRTSTTTTVRQLSGVNGSDDDEPPSYTSIQQSVEDEGIEMDDSYAQPAHAMQQGWSFDDRNSIDGGSDIAQISGDERRQLSEDTEMRSNTSDLDPDSDAELDARDGVISVPATTAGLRGSEEVAEIHVEEDKTTRHV